MTEQTQALDRSNLLFSRDALIRLIVPLIIEQLLLMTVGMADTVMVTTAGEATVSGVSLVDNINTLIIQIFSALSTGGAVVVAQYLGRQETHSAKTAAKQLLYVMTGISAVLMILALIFRQHILSLIFGQVEPAVMDSALVYFLLTAAAYPFMGIYNAGAALFRAMGNSKVSMINSFIINVINILVNAILIFGFGMGAAGAGIGTLVSRIAAAVIIMVMLRHPGLTVQVDDIFHFEFNGSMIRRILFIGIPTGMENGMFQAGKLMVLNLRHLGCGCQCHCQQHQRRYQRTRLCHGSGHYHRHRTLHRRRRYPSGSPLYQAAGGLQLPEHAHHGQRALLLRRLPGNAL